MLMIITINLFLYVALVFITKVIINPNFFFAGFNFSSSRLSLKCRSKLVDYSLRLLLNFLCCKENLNTNYVVYPFKFVVMNINILIFEHIVRGNLRHIYTYGN